MSFVANNTQQLSMNDRYNNMTEREKKMINDSWAKSFAEIIFPSIHEERFAVLYSSNDATRPSNPINVTVGGMMLKEMLNHSDEDMVTGIVFDIRLQYALHTTSYDEQPLSDRTFSRFRKRLYDYEMETGVDLLKEEILYLADKITEFMELKPYMKRMDSLMIASACKDMTRLEVVYVTTANLVKAVHRAHGDELLAGVENYLKEDEKNRVIYYNKPEDRAAKTQEIIEDCALLLKRLGEEGAELPEYMLAKRMLEDQSVVDGAGKHVMKGNKEIKPDSLQNPSDPDATYRKKAGKHHTGYVGNVVETYNEEGASVITDYSFEQNRHSDSDFCKEAIKNIAAKGEGTKENKVTIVADGSFASAENSELAKENNIILITTDMAGQKPPEMFADFEINYKNNRIAQCPAGHVPLRQGRNQATDTYRIVMEKSQCANCSHREECNVKMQKKSAVVLVSVNKVNRAKTIKNQNISVEEYVKLRNLRNAIEGTPSVMRRVYAVDAMPVFGLLKSKMMFGLKVAAANLRKLEKFTREKSACLLKESYPQEQYA
jgi:hypothetical protein